MDKMETYFVISFLKLWEMFCVFLLVCMQSHYSIVLKLKPKGFYLFFRAESILFSLSQ